MIGMARMTLTTRECRRAGNHTFVSYLAERDQAQLEDVV